MSEAYVYVIGAVEGPLKIGITHNPAQRLRQLQTASPQKLQIHHQAIVDRKNVAVIEQIIHRSNGFRRLSGEWFDMTIAQARAEVDVAVMQFGDDEALVLKHRQGAIRF